jgi:YidC/Oxa1 family membrane protein insertase
MEHEKRELASTRWLALRNQYFTVIIKPGVEAAGYFCAGVKEIDGLPGVRGGLILSEFGMRPGEVKDIAFDVYIGPKEMSALSDFGASEVINLGWFGFLGKWILVGLNAIYGLLGNYGLAIIVLTIIIRLILFPLNQKSFRSMSEMQKVQPRIAELQSKYKDDPKKKQQEMMKIYKEHGVNPMGGCLPMLLQFPILIAFFRVLQNAIELWGAPFVLWIKDLSEPDALFTIRTGGESAIPLIGRMINGEPCILLNILPLLMLLTFFIQQKMSTPGMATTPEQAQQQKMMKLMMPLMFGVIFYNMPAGLNLYFTVSTLLGIVQQKYMIR